MQSINKCLIIGIIFTIVVTASRVESALPSDEQTGSDYSTNNFKSPNSKYYYWFAPRSSYSSTYDNILTDTYKSSYDKSYESGSGGYDKSGGSPDSSQRGDYEYSGHAAHWPSIVPQPTVIYQPPAHYHQKDDKSNYIWPLLLLALLPFIFGALLLLPLLITFFTNLLQLLAMMQQTMQQSLTTTTAASAFAGRKRRHLPGVKPFLTSTVITLVEDFSTALEKYENLR